MLWAKFLSFHIIIILLATIASAT